MGANAVHSCPACGALHRTLLEETDLIACRNCGGIVVSNVKGTEQPLPSRMPPDWSFMQIGATGEYEGVGFSICGRIRLQLRNEYKNFWCAALPHALNLWIMESFGSFSVLSSRWHLFSGDVATLHAGKDYTLGDTALTGEYVEKIEGISYAGELGRWRAFVNQFFFVQGSNNRGDTAVFFVAPGGKIEYLAGKKVTPDALKLTNTQAADEWKQ